MKIPRFSLIPAMLLLAALAAWPTAGQQSDQAEVQLKAAMNRELVDGDLKGAIEQYQKIVSMYPQRRDVAARAIFQIGQCYEKLGREEAQKAYQQIIKDYADQPRIVAEARARLTALAPAGKQPDAGAAAGERAAFTIRKMDFAEIQHTHQARLSPDGKRLLYIHYQQEKEQQPYSIRVMDLATGLSTILFEGIDFGANNIFVWSPDGKRVVFKRGRGELRLVNSNGGPSQVLWSVPDAQTGVFPCDWSSDGRSILIGLLNNAAGKSDLATLPVAGGEAKIVVSGKPNELAEIGRFSPDATHIVGMKRLEKNTDIYIWSVDGKRESRLTDHPAADENPLWSPDGRYIIFTSDRADTVDLWAIPMDGPNPSGFPLKIRTNLGKNTIPADLTAGGRLTMYASSSTGKPSDLFVLPMNPKTGEASGELRRFAKTPWRGIPMWSPDGSRGAYTSRKGNFQLPNIYVRTAGASEEVEIPAKNHWIGNIEWARDGKSLLFPGWNNDDRRVGIFRVSLESSAFEPILLGGPYGSGFQGAYFHLKWLPLAGKYFFEKWLSETEKEIYTMDPNGSNVQRVAERVASIVYTFPSPDGRYLVSRTKEHDLILVSLKDGSTKTLIKNFSQNKPIYFAWSPDAQKITWVEEEQLKIYAVGEGVARSLVQSRENQKLRALTGFWTYDPWSPDSAKIVYAVEYSASDSTARTELWMVDMSGAPPRKIATPPSGYPLMSPVLWHPSGEMIYVTCSASNEGTRYEHWIMENFLPSKAGQSDRK
jgi:Tol biopolymer transport system component